MFSKYILVSENTGEAVSKPASMNAVKLLRPFILEPTKIVYCNK